MKNNVFGLLSRLEALQVKLWDDEGYLGVDAPEDVLTPALLAEVREHKEEILTLLRQGRAAEVHQELRARPHSGKLPVSPAQRRLWFLSQLEGANVAYNMPFITELRGPLDTGALSRGIAEIVRRHESLRTTFCLEAEGPMQVIHPPALLDVPLEDLSGLDQAAQDAEIEQWIEREALWAFDMERGPLLRARILRMSQAHHVLCLVIHHIVGDGWSMGVFVRELAALYGAFVAGRPSPLPPLPLQYADWSRWQEARFSGSEGERQVAYWRRKLADLQPLRLPTDRPRPSVESFRGDHHVFYVDRELLGALHDLSREEGVTLYITLLAAFDVLLARYSGQVDIAVSSGTANRNHPALEGLIGFFVNTLVVRCDLSDNPTFRALLQRVRASVMEATEHEDLPFERVVEELRPERTASQNPLAQVALTLQSFADTRLTFPGLEASPRSVRFRTSKFDLMLLITEADASLQVVVEYNADLFERRTVERMSAHFEVVLRDIARDRTRPIGEISLLDDEERRRLLVAWNRTEAPFSSEACIHQLFEAHADRAPDAIALVDLCSRAAGAGAGAGASNQSAALTYRELDRRANQVAHHLRRHGVGPDVLVGLCLPRGADLIVGLLGVLKAGGAVVVLDPEHPRQRLAVLLEDTGAPVLLTRAPLLEGLPETRARVVDFDRGFAGEPTHRPESGALPKNLAYVLYTSGTTGQPNGALIEHRGFVNSIEAHIRLIETGPGARLAHVLSFSFDAAIAHLFDTICAGGALYLAPRDSDFLSRGFVELMEREAITHTALVPSMLAALPDAALPALHTLVVGGEKCSAELVTRWGRKRRLINVYGPTEVSILATSARCVPDGNAPPIGRPIANIQAYVLDRWGQLAPPGVVGELCLGGVGVARGYLNRPELTARKFIQNPFGEGRLYRTGDLVRYRAADDRAPDLEFIGRLDSQVKIRGYRVELSEVESALRASPLVRDAVVTVQEAGDGASAGLVAYVTPARLPQSQRAKAWESERIASWDKLNAQVVDEEPSDRELLLDIKGWKSSYTHEDIPQEEMRAWAESTVARILDLAPQEVLEIGCGTGMLLARVAPRVRRYRGTDLSRHALKHVELLKAKLGGLENVHVSQQPAHDLAGLAGERFDTVILNSVIQYFPSADYLLGVIEGLLGLMPEAGSIFIGDVRNLSLLPAYHASVERFRAGGSLPRRELRARVERALVKENELCVHPQFFTALRARFPQIADVDIAPKLFGYKNELSAFRYDVTLRIGAKPAAPAPASIEWRDVGAEGLTLDDVHAWIARSAPGRALGLRGIPNARLREENALVRWLSADDDDDRRPWQPPPLDPRAWDPEALSALSSELSCHVSLSWAAGRPDGSLDAIVTPGDREAAPHFPLDPPAAPASFAELANDPLLSIAYRELSADLRRELGEALPAHLVPSMIVVLPALPLTLNGKVDMRALPLLSAGNAASEQSAPRNDVERKLAEVWCSVLGLSQVGVHDDFFDLGGHSLLAITMMAQVEAVFGRRIPITALFKAPTIEALARRISGPVVDSLLNVIQPDGDRAPLFWATGIGIHIAHLRTLGQRLGADQPLYGIQPLDLEAEMPNIETMEALAVRVADSIQKVQPAGPYTLSGHSGGAVIALPVALELEARGHQTTLVIIDMHAPNPRPMPSEDEFNLPNYVGRMQVFLGDRLGLNIEELKQLPQREAWQRVADHFQRVNFLPPGPGVELLRRLVMPSKILRMMLSYRPASPYRGRLVLLKAGDANEDGRRVPTDGWQEICARPVTTFTVPGNHVTMILEPHVDAVVEHLRRLIDESQASARDAFPVLWDDPEEAQVLWMLDMGHNSEPMSPLDFDLRMCSQVEGSNRASALYGVPSRARPKLIHGFAYQGVIHANVSAEEAASALSEVDAAVRRVGRELDSRWEKMWLPEIEAQLAELNAFDLRAASLPAVLKHLAELKDRLTRLWKIHFELLSPVLLALSDFEEAYRDLFPDAKPIDAYELLAGFPNKTTEGNLRLWQIGHAAARKPSLRALLTERSLAELPAALAETAEGRALWSALLDYLSVYGERNDSLYIDAPTWIDDSTPVLRGLREAVLQPERDLAAELQQQARRRESRLAEVRGRLASHPRAVVEEFEALLKAAQVATVLSEDHNFWLDCKITHHARRVCLEVGRRLSERGVIEAPSDVFSLSLSELAALSDDPKAESTGARALIAERRAESARFAGVNPPPMLGAMRPLGPMDSAMMKASLKFNGSYMAPPGEGGLSGMAGSSGKVAGPARVVRSLDDAEKLRPGDVLVAPATLPSWTPLFASVAAVVTDHGGVLCHAAVVAREYGIPAVVGTRRATEALADGQLIEVDGDAGVVRVVAR